jgi:4-carboxymuconolactone decarboxylase
MVAWHLNPADTQEQGSVSCPPRDGAADNEQSVILLPSNRVAKGGTIMKYRTGVCIISLLVLAGSVAAQSEERRFRLIPLEQMTPEQRTAAEAIMSGPRASVPGSSATGKTPGSPFNPWLRSPELADRLQRVGEYLRFRSSIPPRLNEFAILVTARQWNSQYEWHAHHRLALQAGLNPAVAADLAEGKRPAGMQEDETIVYNFCRELHQERKVSDATYKAALDQFGERGVMDLIAVSGYYVLVSMTLNVDRTPVPGEGKPPLRPLPR